MLQCSSYAIQLLIPVARNCRWEICSGEEGFQILSMLPQTVQNYQCSILAGLQHVQGTPSMMCSQTMFWRLSLVISAPNTF